MGSHPRPFNYLFFSRQEMWRELWCFGSLRSRENIPKDPEEKYTRIFPLATFLEPGVTTYFSPWTKKIRLFFFQHDIWGWGGENQKFFFHTFGRELLAEWQRHLDKRPVVKEICEMELSSSRYRDGNLHRSVTSPDVHWHRKNSSFCDVWVGEIGISVAAVSPPNYLSWRGKHPIDSIW